MYFYIYFGHYRKISCVRYKYLTAMIILYMNLWSLLKYTKANTVLVTVCNVNSWRVDPYATSRYNCVKVATASSKITHYMLLFHKRVFIYSIEIELGILSLDLYNAEEKNMTVINPCFWFEMSRAQYKFARAGAINVQYCFSTISCQFCIFCTIRRRRGALG